MGDARWKAGLIAAAGAVAVLSLWLRAAFPLHVIAAPEDDLLFIRLADYLRHGDWLGPYDSLTLVKGMFYPLFIAAAATLGVPLKLAEQGVYLAAAAGLAVMAARLAKSRAAGLVLFNVLAFNPALWTWSLARVIREGLYIGLSPALLAAAAFAFARAGRRGIAAAVFAGAIGGTLWLTREEGPAFLPMIACLGIFAAAAYGPRRVVALVAGSAVAGAMVLAVSAVNFAHYGVFTDVEFKSPGFTSAYGALSRIAPADWQRYVVVPRQARVKAYAVSPAAAELAPTLEGPRKAEWMGDSCTLQAIDPCPDIMAGLFMWALREAADAAGHYKTAPGAEAYYTTLAAEIDRACDTGDLTCLAPRRTFAPPFRPHYIADTLAASGAMTALTLSMGEAEVFSYPEHAGPEDYRLFAALSGAPPARTPFEVTEFSGWAAGPAELTGIEIRDPAGTARGAASLGAAAPDFTRGGRTLLPRQFTAAPECAEAGCRAVFAFADGSRREVPLAALGDYPARAPDFVLTIESIGGGPPDVLAAKHAQNRVHDVARLIARCYAITVPVFAFTGLAGLLLAAWRFRRDPDRLFLTGIGLAAAVFALTRIALLSYLDVTSIPSLLNLYVAPATPFVLVAAVLGNFLAWQALPGAHGNMRRPKLAA